MPHVLIVEDDPHLREMLELLLEFNGYTTESATNGREALECVLKRRPCLVLLDLMMPEMTGWEFRKRQRNNPHIASVPVICVTAVHDQAAASKELQALCLPKPVDFDALLAAVSTNCGPAK